MGRGTQRGPFLSQSSCPCVLSQRECSQELVVLCCDALSTTLGPLGNHQMAHIRPHEQGRGARQAVPLREHAVLCKSTSTTTTEPATKNSTG